MSSSDENKKERAVQGQSENQQDTKNQAKERLQFDFSPDAVSRLDQLKTRLNVNTRAEVVRLALRLLEFF